MLRALTALIKCFQMKTIHLMTTVLNHPSCYLSPPTLKSKLKFPKAPATEKISLISPLTQKTSTIRKHHTK